MPSYYELGVVRGVDGVVQKDPRKQPIFLC